MTDLTPILSIGKPPCLLFFPGPSRFGWHCFKSSTASFGDVSRLPPAVRLSSRATTRGPHWMVPVKRRVLKRASRRTAQRAQRLQRRRGWRRVHGKPCGRSCRRVLSSVQPPGYGAGNGARLSSCESGTPLVPHPTPVFPVGTELAASLHCR